MESQSETTQTVSALKLPVIVNGGSVIPTASASTGAEGPIPPKTDEQKLARKNKLKAKSTLMLAIPDEHLLKFHSCKDAHSLWEAVKNRFGGNKESKKMQKTILKQNYENFTASIVEKFTTSLEQYCFNHENKSDLDELSMDDLYNNLKVYESEIKGQTSSSSNSHNVAFVSFDNSSSTNETVNVAHSVSAASAKDQAFTTSYADDIDADDLKEMDLKWQVAMLTMRVKRFIMKIGRKLDLNGKETVGFDIIKVECYNCHRRGHFAREYRAPKNQGNRNRDAPRRNALYDQQREALNKSNIEIIGYQMGLESLEARIVVHEKNEVLENALKEKDDLKLKLEKFETSSKNLTKLINSQITAKDKTGLGFDEQVNESEVLDNVFDSHESDGDDNPRK
ncbi:ribonuclease H-like domain-containing protein [Tanacetum coccineum]